MLPFNYSSTVTTTECASLYLILPFFLFKLKTQTTNINTHVCVWHIQNACTVSTFYITRIEKMTINILTLTVLWLIFCKVIQKVNIYSLTLSPVFFWLQSCTSEQRKMGSSGGETAQVRVMADVMQYDSENRAWVPCQGAGASNISLLQSLVRDFWFWKI